MRFGVCGSALKLHVDAVMLQIITVIKENYCSCAQVCNVSNARCIFITEIPLANSDVNSNVLYSTQVYHNAN